MVGERYQKTRVANTTALQDKICATISWTENENNKLDQ
jgi:hypothetical protein